MKHKSPDAHISPAVEKQVLRAAERREQRSPYSRYVLHSDNREDVFFFISLSEYKDGKRYKNDKGHIICHKHGREEHPKHQKECEGNHGFQLGCKTYYRVKDALLLKALKHTEHHKKHTKGMPVYLPPELFCWGSYKK